MANLAQPARGSAKSSDNRRFPRLGLTLKAKIILQGGGSKKQERTLEAVLATRDVSMTGVFFESTFFLKVGALVRIEFILPKDDRVIGAFGTIVREERPGRPGSKEVRSGFAVHFTEFVEDSAVVLASLFLAPRVKTFIETYLRVRRPKDRNETDRLVDAVVAWELGKTDPSSVWSRM